MAEEVQSSLAGFWDETRLNTVTSALIQHYFPLTVRVTPWVSLPAAAIALMHVELQMSSTNKQLHVSGEVSQDCIALHMCRRRTCTPGSWMQRSSTTPPTSAASRRTCAPAPRRCTFHSLRYLAQCNIEQH